MELKDWILLVIPIVCNGVILFLFQQILMIQIKKNERINTYKQDVLKEFLSYLQEFYIQLRNIRSIDSERSGKEYEFSSLWNPAVKAMENMVVFFDVHPVTTKKVRPYFLACINKWQNIIDTLFESKKNNNGKVSYDCSIAFSREYEEMNELIKVCMACCDQEIIE